MDGTGDNPPAERPTLLSDRPVSSKAMAYRLLGIGCALVGVLLVIGGLLTLRGKPAPPAPGAASSGGATTTTTTATTSSPASATPSPTPTSTAPASTAPSTAAVTTAPSASRPPSPARPAASTPAAARAPLTVLNNTTVAHLAEQAAEQFRRGGWQVVKVGNFTGTIPATTVYYTPGSATEERAAEALAAQFTGISRVLPRYAGLPTSVHGVIVVLAPDWL